MAQHASPVKLQHCERVGVFTVVLCARHHSMLANIITSSYILGMYEISRYLGIITQHVLRTNLTSRVHRNCTMLVQARHSLSVIAEVLGSFPGWLKLLNAVMYWQVELDS